MTTFVPESGPATDPNAVSPPEPVYADCNNCGTSLENARLATVDHDPRFHAAETVYLCWCGRWHCEDAATP